MTNFLNYLWPILIALYIISPFDAHPLFLDDLIAAGVLFYLLYRNVKHKKQQQQYYSYYNTHNQSKQGSNTKSQDTFTLEDAYRLLHVSPDASWEEINKAYREKMSKSHPDKVSHLSEELQERAKELSLKLNEAYDLIKQHKK